ncbi:MAG: response regulator [Acidobacteriota bacterium]
MNARAVNADPRRTSCVVKSRCMQRGAVMFAAINDNAGRAPVILVAEDDPAMRRLIVVTLRRDGFDVIESKDGAELDTMIRRVFEQRVDPRAIDAIVADQRMPRVSGLDVLARLRRADWSTPFILITGLAEPGFLAEARRLGAAAVLEKPFDLAALRSAAHRYAGAG